jgi:hypothetical protein
MVGLGIRGVESLCNIRMNLFTLKERNCFAKNTTVPYFFSAAKGEYWVNTLKQAMPSSFEIFVYSNTFHFI